ncbi:MAG: polyprenyl synthetase family protein [Bdellovibrionales bacterium]|jgi:geranylgeranyl pyrophosphate synthase|nr:polyprenyl synthetase family protein [Bdellovibrionales bacterium]
MKHDLFKSIPADVLAQLNNIGMALNSTSKNQEVNNLLNKTVLIGGKRLRPLLTLLMGNLYNINSDDLAPYAKSIELVHAASLAHDDVVDNATTRRGNPSINIVSSNKYAVLSGDYLLADVIVGLCNLGNLELVKEMSLVIQELSEGEWIQLNASKSREYTREVIELIAMKKTSSVLSWCTVAPAIYAGLSPTIVDYARKLGAKLGLAFQMMDDTLDFSGNSQKDAFLDLDNGIINSVIFEWLIENNDSYEKFKNGMDLQSIWCNANFTDAIQVVENKAQSLLKESQEILDIMVKELSLIPESNHEQIQKAAMPITKIIEFIGNRNF